jgi:uncharacterized protein DUF2752
LRPGLKQFLPLALIAGIFCFSLLVPQGWLNGLPLCYFKYVTGLDCPGCGLTRAFSLLFKGHLRAAIGMNALAPVLALWLALYALRDIYMLRNGQRPDWFTVQGNRVISRLFLILFLGQWIWKTILAFLTAD